MEPFAKRQKAEPQLSVEAAEAISLHLLRNVGGQIAIEEDGTFPPEFTHQLFGQEEVIKGYDALEIDLWLTPHFRALVDVKYAKKEPGATDLEAPFTQLFGEGRFFTRKADFDEALAAEPPLDLAALGEQVAEAATAEGTQFVVLRSNIATASQQLKELSARLQPLLLFFVDGASAIDAEDEGWDLYLAVEKSPDAVDVMGFATTFTFYRYPEGCRLRLSQMLVLPPHQGRGVGSLLLEAVYAAAEKAGAPDLTFEDPTEQLQRMRDKLDLQRALALGWPRQAAEAEVAAAQGKGAAAAADDKGKGKASVEEGVAAGASGSGAAPGGEAADGGDGGRHYPLAPPKELLQRMQHELRLSKQQALRVYELLVYLLAAPAPGGAVLAERMVRGRIQRDADAAESNGANKVMRDLDAGFIMCKGKGSLVPAGAVEGVSAEEKAEAVEAAVEQHLGQLKAVVTAVAANFK